MKNKDLKPIFEFVDETEQKQDNQMQPKLWKQHRRIILLRRKRFLPEL